MGGGDLNMKKSWHTGLFSNQERVWKQEKAALEERKRTADLQKELAQERAVQELQRLQEEAGGKKREQRVDWMYAAPAEGNGPNAEELEQYLLGKKRVDQLLKGNEEKLMAAPTESAPGGSFTSLQNANSARDTANKIREDPLLAIKRQEQLQYEKLLKNPKKMKELRAARVLATNGGKTPSGEVRKSKKDETKEERRARKEAKRGRHGDEGEGSGSGSKRRREDDDRRGERRHEREERSRSPARRSSHYDEGRDSRRDRDRDDRGSSSRRDDYRREDSSRRTDDYSRDRDDRRDSRDHRDRRPADRDEDRRPRQRSRSPPPPPRESSSSYSAPPHQQRNGNGSGNGYNNHSNGNSNGYRRPPPPSSAPPPPSAEEEAARKASMEARLAAMQSSASALHTERNARLAKLEAEDQAQLEKELESRKKGGSGLNGVGPKFLRDQEKQVFGGGMDLAERMKRSGRVGMVGDRE